VLDVEALAGLLRPPQTLRTDRLVLESLGPQHLEGSWLGVQDEEGRRLTGTHATFTREQIAGWLNRIGDEPDRADWAIVRADTAEHVGEAVLNDLDLPNACMSFRIALPPQAIGRGYGTEATRAVVDHGFAVLGLHRIELEVYAFNSRAQRVYEKCGFAVEGRRRDALRWEGTWYDAITMAVLETDPR
jgi:RimJ/RimL family protein N-acetyltransferase